jgi:hypothetical protein
MTANKRTRTSDPPRRVPTRPRRSGGRARRLVFWPVASALLAAALLAGCGGSSKGSGTVAHISTSSSANKRTKSHANPSGIAYSQCVRSHGVPAFPDPNSQGDFEMSVGSGIDPNSPTVQAAENDCRSLLPHKVTQAQEDAQLAKALRASACIQKNGYPSFPDPSISNGSIGTDLTNSSIDVSSPAFQRVAKKCGEPGGL